MQEAADQIGGDPGTAIETVPPSRKRLRKLHRLQHSNKQCPLPLANRQRHLRRRLHRKHAAAVEGGAKHEAVEEEAHKAMDGEVHRGVLSARALLVGGSLAGN